MIIILVITLVCVLIFYYFYWNENRKTEGAAKSQIIHKQRILKIESRPKKRIKISEQNCFDGQSNPERRIECFQSTSNVDKVTEVQPQLENLKGNSTFSRRENQQEQRQEHHEDQENQINQDQVIQSPNKPDINIIYKIPNALTSYEDQSIRTIWQNFLRAGEPDMGLKDNSLVFLIYDNDNHRIIGMASILMLDEYDLSGPFAKFKHLNLDQNSLILYNVCIHPDYRRMGIAQQLLTDIEVWARSNQKTKIILFVKNHNSAAQTLYNKCSYQMDMNYKDPNTNSQGDCEFLMSKVLG